MGKDGTVPLPQSCLPGCCSFSGAPGTQTASWACREAKEVDRRTTGKSSFELEKAGPVKAVLFSWKNGTSGLTTRREIKVSQTPSSMRTVTFRKPPAFLGPQVQSTSPSSHYPMLLLTLGL